MHENVGQFEVPMHDFVFDEGLEGTEDLDKELDGFLFWEGLIFFEVLAQISLVAVLQDEVKVIGSLLDVIQLDDASVVAGSEHFDLILEQFQELPCVVR